jgi:hypothetical protein
MERRKMLLNSLEIAIAQLQQITSDLEAARAEAAALGEDLLQAGAPWVEGTRLPGLDPLPIQ